MTLTDQILNYVETHPGHSAWAIAKGIGASSASVSSILHYKAERGILQRKKSQWMGTWVYYPPVKIPDYEEIQRVMNDIVDDILLHENNRTPNVANERPARGRTDGNG